MPTLQATIVATITLQSEMRMTTGMIQTRSPLAVRAPPAAASSRTVVAVGRQYSWGLVTSQMRWILNTKRKKSRSRCGCRGAGLALGLELSTKFISIFFCLILFTFISHTHKVPSVLPGFCKSHISFIASYQCIIKLTTVSFHFAMLLYIFRDMYEVCIRLLDEI